ncbi:hypothetical protein V1525DRAFT_406787 [Lipomyces kononenkoae]|uniref:Uncharacterized protein n=1 Tax=Lipomyces kononenkoae TaxID=34357 RepID=A0ACC3SXZ0_LIPKO
MCGIFACHQHPDVIGFKPKALQLSKLIRHRGPDWSGNFIKNNTIIAHERLAIVGLDSGAQPLTNEDDTLALGVNGEIYNHVIIRHQIGSAYKFKTQSDCEVIIPLYQKYDIDCANHLDGMFAFVLYDAIKDRMVAARDPIGITTLYMGRSSTYPGAVFFASEMKSLSEVCDDIIVFPPGHVYDSSTDKFTRYFNPSWWDGNRIPSTPVDYKAIRTTLEAAVRKRLMAEVPYGVLLSGGLDSSLIASIAARETLKAQSLDVEGQSLTGVDEQGNLSGAASWPRLHSYAVGLPGAPDLVAAQKVAKFIGTVHHEHTFTLQEGLDALSDVIYHLETYDVTTIRASTPMYLLSRKIKAQGVKMVLSGEGSDEIFGGYLYFGAAPSKEDFHRETVQRVKNLHFADCLRANKSTCAWGLEARVPFLDKSFLELVMNIDPAEKMITKDRIEKYILRKAFDTTGEDNVKPYLPDEILWRQKEQFSDGVGYSWIDCLKDSAEKFVSDEDFANPKPEWGADVPTTKEAYWYRCMFDEHFPSKTCADTVMRWIPKADWGCAEDPSGRYVKSHLSAV